MRWHQNLSWGELGYSIATDSYKVIFFTLQMIVSSSLLSSQKSQKSIKNFDTKKHNNGMFHAKWITLKPIGIRGGQYVTWNIPFSGIILSYPCPPPCGAERRDWKCRVRTSWRRHWCSMGMPMGWNAQTGCARMGELRPVDKEEDQKWVILKLTISKALATFVYELGIICILPSEHLMLTVTSESIPQSMLPKKVCWHIHAPARAHWHHCQLGIAPHTYTREIPEPMPFLSRHRAQIWGFRVFHVIKITVVRLVHMSLHLLRSEHKMPHGVQRSCTHLLCVCFCVCGRQKTHRLPIWAPWLMP